MEVFWVSSDLNSGKKISFSFSGGGGWGVVLEPNSRTGVFWRIWSKISGSQLAGASQIVSHILRMWTLISRCSTRDAPKTPQVVKPSKRSVPLKLCFGTHN